MATFIKSKDDKLINLYYVQNIVINPENDKEIIIYNKNGESITESYDTAEEASTAYDNYANKMEESSGGGSDYNVKMNTVFTSTNYTLIHNIVELPSIDLRAANKASNLFGSCKNLKKIGSLNTTGITSSMNRLFYDCTLLEYVPVFDTSNTSDVSELFRDCKSLTNVPLLDTSSATKFGSMFSGCKAITTIPLLDTSNATNMTNMFYGCSNLTDVPLLNTSNVTDMSSMFSGCVNLTEIPLFDTSNVTNMAGMFLSCQKLETIPIFNTSKVINMGSIFFDNRVLSNESLNNILQMCINATLVPTKTLKYLGLSKNYEATCQSLSNYQAFLDAGWTTGY